MRARRWRKRASAAIIPGGWTKTLIFIVLSPFIGLAFGLGLMTAIFWLFRWTPPSRVDRWFRRLQLVSAAFFSLNHGANDAQKTMGIIAGVLFAAGYIQTFYIPFWVILAAHAAISLGTLAGGWRIIHTMGSKITKLQPVSGFAAETGAALRAADCDAVRRAGQHDARHHRRDCRRRRHAAAVGRAMGRRRPDRVGVAADHSRRVHDRRGRVFAAAVVRRRTLTRIARAISNCSL